VRVERLELAGTRPSDFRGQKGPKRLQGGPPVGLTVRRRIGVIFSATGYGGTQEAALGDWQVITPLVQSWLGQWAALLSNIPDAVMLAASLLPIALAVFSKRLIVLLVCILLAVTFFCALIAPSNVAVTLATSAYFGSVILAVSAIVSRRKAKVHRAEFARLREDVQHLLNAEHRRFLNKLGSSKKGGGD